MELITQRQQKENTKMLSTEISDISKWISVSKGKKNKDNYKGHMKETT